MKKIFLRKSVEVAIVLMLIICALLPFAFPVAGAGNTAMGCYPSSYDVTVGETFNVTVWLNADENVDSWLVDLLNFNETVLGMINATAVSISSFWKSSGFYDNGTIDNDSGKITGIQALFIYSESTVNTTLFTVDFVALKPGLCYINLTDAEAFSGGPNVLHTWYNTSVTIHQEGPVLSGENPSNGATSVEITQSTVNVTITDAEGDPMDWTIQGQYVTNTGANGATNGSVSANLITPLPYGTTVTWYVNVTDGYDWTNETYHLTTRSRPSGGGGGSCLGNLFSFIAGLIGVTVELPLGIIGASPMGQPNIIDAEEQSNIIDDIGQSDTIDEETCEETEIADTSEILMDWNTVIEEDYSELLSDWYR